MTRLMGLHFKIMYKKGSENVAADSLSRVAHILEVQAISIAQPTWIQEILNSYAIDAEACTQLQALAIHSPDELRYSLEKGIIRHNGRVWIGDNAALQTKLISVFH